jgi:hypothetical protein
MASMPSSSSSYNSAHISMRAATGILWSSGNKPRSRKHFLMTSLSKKSRLFWRQTSRSRSESRIERPLHHFFTQLFKTSADCPRSDPPITLRARGNPPQTFSICKCRPPNKISYCLEVTGVIFVCLLFGDKLFIRNKTSKHKCMHKYANMILAGSHGIMYLLKQAMASCNVFFLSYTYISQNVR